MMQSCVSGVSPLSSRARRPPNEQIRCGPFEAEIPLHDIDRVSAEVRHLPAGVVPEPSEMINPALRIERPFRRRTEPHVVVEITWRGGRRGERRSQDRCYEMLRNATAWTFPM